MHPTTASPDAQASPRTAAAHLTRNRDFVVLTAGQAVSTIGNFTFNTTLGIWIAAALAKGQPWAPLAVSAVFVAAAVPAITVGPLAGVFVDRWEKRATMLWVDALRTLLVLALVLATGIVPLPFFPGWRVPDFWALGAVYVVVFLVNACDRFFQPALLALVGDLVTVEQQPAAMGFNSATFSVAILVGPPLAAVLYAFGPTWSLLIDAASFAVSVLTLLALRPPQSARSVRQGERGHVWRELGAGLRLYFGSRVLVVLLVTGIIAFLGAGALNVMEVFFVTANLYLPAADYGYLGAAQGVGMIVGAVITGFFVRRLGLTRVLWLSIALAGVLFVAYGRQTSLPATLLVVFLFGIPLTALDVAASPILLRAAPREFVGRVMAVFQPLTMLASIVGMVLAGALDSSVLHNFSASILGTTFHAVDTIFTAAGVLFVLAGVYAALGLRGVPPDIAPPASAPAHGMEERA